MARNAMILVPVDGSKESLRALKHAVTHRPHASFVLLHAQEPMIPSQFVTRSMIAEHQAQQSVDALRAARALVAKHKVAAEVITQPGLPGDVIADVASRKRCAEIVMGTRGQGRFLGFVIGSTAMRVVQLARVPVTLVR